MADPVRSIFITATDTGGGKTAVTTFLLRRLLASGIDASALKPIASGIDEDGTNGDITALLSASGETETDRINLYRFTMPAAPSLAAAAEDKSIDPEKLIAWCRKRCQEHRICLIEGVGGLMVPLTSRFLVRDWLAGMPEAEIMLVVPARLGAINHALLTLAELKRMGKSPRWIVINDADGGGQPIAAQIAEALHDHLAPGISALMLPYMDDGRQDIAGMVDVADSSFVDWDRLVGEYSG